MAFVIKTKKGLEFRQPETNDIGPGEYLSQTKIKQFKLSKAPFSVNVPKGDHKDNQVPGPGTYYQDDLLLNYLRNIYNEKKTSHNDKDQVLLTKGNEAINLKQNVERLGFCQKEKRFKQLTQGNPGPGRYFTSKSPINQMYQGKNRVISERKRMKQLIALRQEACIPSIPVNHQVFGFDITSNGALIRKPNPEMYRTFSGEKGDTVGPGSYELDAPNQWHKSGVDWSKAKTTRATDDKKEIDKYNQSNSKLIDLQGLSLRTTGYSENKLGADKTKMSFRKCTIIKGTTTNTLTGDLSHPNILKKPKTTREHTTNTLNYNLNKIIQHNSPGPGYYIDIDQVSSFKSPRCPEFKQFFGSKIERFQRVKDNPLTSPATYFSDEQKATTTKQHKDKSMSNIASFSTRSERFFQSEFKEPQPGPGQYNLQDQFNKKIDDDRVAKFGSTEKRFSQTARAIKEDYSTPGPGAYYNLFNGSGASAFKWNGILLNIDRVKELDRDSSNPLLFKSKSTWNTFQSNAPPVGQYNPELVYTIDYKIKKNKRLNLSEDIAFNSGISKEHKQEQTNMDIGPGYYYHDKTTEVKQVMPPFHQSAIKQTKIKKPSPGDYNCASYYDWNKKTYNINYV